MICRLAVQPGRRRPELVRVADDGRRSAVIGAAGTQNLTDLLATDPHLAPFLAIPSKDNGLDVEGLAVHGDTLYIGLRGPVLRGWACVLEVLPTPDDHDPTRLRFAAFNDGTRYRKHLLDLGGLGVRDLCPDGDDLLVLAGPSMALSGSVRLHRWHRAAQAETSRVVRGAELTLETELPGAGRPRGGHRFARSVRRAAPRGLRQPSTAAAAHDRVGHRRPRPDRATRRPVGRLAAHDRFRSCLTLLRQQATSA